MERDREVWQLVQVGLADKVVLLTVSVVVSPSLRVEGVTVELGLRMGLGMGMSIERWHGPRGRKPGHHHHLSALVWVLRCLLRAVLAVSTLLPLLLLPLLVTSELATHELGDVRVALLFSEGGLLLGQRRPAQGQTLALRGQTPALRRRVRGLRELGEVVLSQRLLWVLLLRRRRCVLLGSDTAVQVVADESSRGDNIKAGHVRRARARQREPRHHGQRRLLRRRLLDHLRLGLFLRPHLRKGRGYGSLVRVLTVFFGLDELRGRGRAGGREAVELLPAVGFERRFESQVVLFVFCIILAHRVPLLLLLLLRLLLLLHLPGVCLLRLVLLLV